MEEKEDIGFLGDFKSFIIKLLIGLAPMATLVPLLLNKTHNIFGFSYDDSYIVFTVLYFTLPAVVVFGWIWYKVFFRNRAVKSPTDKEGYFQPIKEFRLPKYAYFMILGVGALIVGVMGFAFHWIFQECLFWIFICSCIGATLLAGPLIRRSVIDYSRIHEQVKGDVSTGGIRAHEKLHTALLQYVLFSLLLLAALCIFDIRFIGRPETAETKEATQKQVHRYIDALKIEQDSVKGYQDSIRKLQDTLKLVFFKAGIQYNVPETTATESIYRRLRPTVDSNLVLLLGILDSVYRRLPENSWRYPDDISLVDYHSYYRSCGKAFAQSGTTITNRLVLLVSQYKQQARIPELEALQDYCLGQMAALYQLSQNYSSSLDDFTRDKWSFLLKRVQFYCFLLFGTGIFWLLTLWFYYYIHSIYSEREKSGGPSADEQHDAEEGKLILGPLKTGIMIFLLLSIPFLRSFDKSTLDLNSPFLHISLSGLFRASSDPERTQINQFIGPNQINIDSSKNYGGGSETVPPADVKKILDAIESSRKEARSTGDAIKRIITP